MYALKDKKLMQRTKGAIELEMYLIYNPVGLKKKRKCFGFIKIILY